MAIEQRIVNDSLTEIYVIGGGNFITQFRPTNFHQFFTRKILTPTEDISDFREVTAAERTALEQADALWEEPPCSFIDLFDKAAGGYGRYNPETGFFELNGIKDITYSQALDIYVASANVGNNNSYLPRNCFYGNRKIRTVLPIFNSTERTEWYQAFKSCVSLEAVSGEIHVYRGTSMFVDCPALRNVSTIIFGGTGAADYMFQGCRSLGSVEIRNLMANISFGQSPKLSLASIEYMVNNRHGSAAITLTLHPTAYARVTDELFAQAAEKNITIAST